MQSETIGGCFLVLLLSGKSLIIYLLSVWYAMKTEKNVLILVPTTSLVEQMHSDFIDYGFKESMMQKIYKDIPGISPNQLQSQHGNLFIRCPRNGSTNFPVYWEMKSIFSRSKSLTGIMNKMVNCKIPSWVHRYIGRYTNTQVSTRGVIWFSKQSYNIKRIDGSKDTCKT